MPTSKTLLKIFVASPGDLEEERKLLSEVVDEFNSYNSEDGYILELVKWETHTRPGFSTDAQSVINHQLNDDYDIFIGLMWSRFGTPTQRADSGTEEEFQRAYEILTSSNRKVEVMFYFKDAPISPSRIDLHQLEKVMDFKKSISEDYGGFYHTFETPDQFRQKARMHLKKIVDDWHVNNASTAIQKAHPHVKSEKEDPIANLSAVDSELVEEDTILDILGSAEEEVSGVI